MKKIALLCVVALMFALVTAAVAQDASQTINILISKLIKNYAMKTNWGNVYFNVRDLHKLVDAAAKLRPIDLGTFVTDQNQLVQLKALGYDKGVVTFNVMPLGLAE